MATIINYKLRITNKKNGYAILFTMVIMTIIMTFAVGMSNGAYKQTILSSTARDSQIAFYQADTAGECALYIIGKPVTLSAGTNFPCGGVDSFGNSIELTVVGNNGLYSLEKSSPDPSRPCFKIETDLINKILIVKGYNVCNPTDRRKVERAIEITY